MFFGQISFSESSKEKKEIDSHVHSDAINNLYELILMMEP